MEKLYQILGALGILFGYFSGLWWIAQRMEWWTFALTGVGGIFVYALIHAIFTVSTRKRR